MENNPAVENAVVDAQNGTAAAPETAPRTLADVIGAEVVEEQHTAQTPTQETKAPETPPKSEPGYVQERIQKAQRKWEASHKEEVEKLSSQVTALTERLIQMDAEKLVADGEFKTLERAVKYLRMEAGLPVDASAVPAPKAAEPKQPEDEQPRDEQGRFASKEPTPAEEKTPVLSKEQTERVEMLARQADTIKEKRGVDVMEIFNKDPEVKEKVLKGDWDFHDVYYAELDKMASRPHVPSPTRVSNGVGIGRVNLRAAKSSEFNKLNDFLSHGGVVDMR